MAGAFTKPELFEIHRKLKAKQDSLEPFLTFSLMQEVLRYKSPNSVQNVLEKLIELGLAEAVEMGGIKKYRMKDA